MHPLRTAIAGLLPTASLSAPGGGGVLLALSLCFGAIVGFSLGLTGGGGSIFAVPLLVYGLHVPPKEAMGVSLAAVGATALFGMLLRLRSGDVEVKTGLVFSLAGMLGAPAGAWIRQQISPTLLLALYSGVMLLVAARMWLKATRVVAETRALTEPAPRDEAGPTCRRDPEGRLHLTSRCMLLLSAVGLGTGVLSGLFGVGGGFVIVPALVLFTGMGIHRAVATSLLAITLISASGVGSMLLARQDFPPTITLLFILGGILGMFAGLRLGRTLSGPRLQKIFAVAILLVAAFVIAKSVVGL